MRNLEQYILKGRSMLMSVKVGQELVTEKIRSLGCFDFAPDSMALDRDTGLFYSQYGVDYKLRSSNGRTKKSDRLKLNLYLDPKRRTSALLDLRCAVENQREELEEIVAGGIGLESKEEAARKFGYFKLSFAQGSLRVEKYEEDEAKIARKKLMAGFFASVQHRLDFSAMEAFSHYKLRDEQEKYFEQMKEQMGGDRVRCWSEEGWNGRQLILFVALVLGSYVRHVWKTRLSGSFSSSLEILDEMRSIRCIETSGHSRKITPFVGAQLEICKAFEIEPPKGCDKKYESLKLADKKRGRPRKKKPIQDNE